MSTLLNVAFAVAPTETRAFLVSWFGEMRMQPSIDEFVISHEFRHTSLYMALFWFQVVSFLVVFDKILLKRIFRRKDESLRWFYVHFVGNAIVCFYAVPHILSLFKDPVNAIVDPVFYWESNWVVTIVHLFHLAFFKCKFDDWVHHVVFALCGAATGYFVNFGELSDLYLFFVSGFPGGIDYMLLALVKEGILSKERRLKLALELNMWVRSPGIVSAWALCCVWMTYRPKDVPHYVCFVVITLASVVNAQFYARQVALAAGRQLKHD